MYDKSEQMKNSRRIKPASRKWNLLGMFSGSTLGGCTILFPEPYRSPVVWIGFASALGLMSTLAVVVHLCRGRHSLASIPTRVWWLLIILGFVGGAIVGYIFWLNGAKLPEDALGGVIITGLLIGFAASEFTLRTIDKEQQSAYRTNSYN
jgi:drug/metabolite transporter (DMT)-like permease